MNLPTTMKAMVLTGHGGLDKYVWHDDWPVPDLDQGDVMIKVAACGLNNTDVNTRTGWYSKSVTEATTGAAYAEVKDDDPTWGGAPIAFPRIQGADAVGQVVAVGQGVDTNLIGKRVMTDGWVRDPADPFAMDKARYFGSEVDGGFAEYARTPAHAVQVVNSNLSDAELATFQCSYTTAEGMLTRAAVTDADTVLIPGASGGVGGALVQLARRRGARTIAMTSASKHEAVAKLGANKIIERAPADLHKALGSEKITVVADVVGGPYWPTLIDVLKHGGRYTCSGAIAGPMVTLDLRTFYLGDLTFTGSTIIPPNIFPDLVGYIERGEIKPVLAATYPLQQLREAQQAFIDKKHTGNIVVTM